MKRYWGLWGAGVVVILLLAAAASAGVFKETRKVSGFDGVVFELAGKLIITQGSAESLVIEGDDASVAAIETEVRQGTLYITRKEIGLKGLFQQMTELKCYLTMKEIREVEITGSGDVEAEKIVSDDLKLTVGGSGEMEMGSVQFNRLDLQVSGSGEMSFENIEGKVLEVSISGSGEMEAAGKIQNETITVSGSGNFTAEKLLSRTADIRVSGSGDVLINVTEELDVSISGSGNVSYHGKPRVHSRVSGSGEVEGLD